MSAPPAAPSSRAVASSSNAPETPFAPPSPCRSACPAGSVRVEAKRSPRSNRYGRAGCRGAPAWEGGSARSAGSSEKRAGTWLPTDIRSARCRSSAVGVISRLTSDTSLRTSKSTRFSSSRPAPILDRSRMSLTTCTSAWPFDWASSIRWRRWGVSSVSSSNVQRPSIPLMGAGTSRLMSRGTASWGGWPVALLPGARQFVDQVPQAEGVRLRRRPTFSRSSAYWTRAASTRLRSVMSWVLAMAFHWSWMRTGASASSGRPAASTALAAVPSDAESVR